MNRLVAALAALLPLLLLGCTATPKQPDPSQAGIGYQGGDGSVTIIAASQRKPAAELRGTTLEGKPFSSTEAAGKTMVINVWGSWCAPCRAEAPALVAVAKQLPEVFFLGINTRDLDPAPAKAFVRNFGIKYPNLYDPDGALLLAFGQLPPKAIPSTLIVDANGRVAARIIGETTAATLKGVIEEVNKGQ